MSGTANTAATGESAPLYEVSAAYLLDQALASAGLIRHPLDRAHCLAEVAGRTTDPEAYHATLHKALIDYEVGSKLPHDSNKREFSPAAILAFIAEATLDPATAERVEQPYQRDRIKAKIALARSDPNQLPATNEYGAIDHYWKGVALRNTDPDAAAHIEDPEQQGAAYAQLARCAGDAEANRCASRKSLGGTGGNRGRTLAK